MKSQCGTIADESVCQLTCRGNLCNEHINLSPDGMPDPTTTEETTSTTIPTTTSNVTITESTTQVTTTAESVVPNLSKILLILVATYF